jgi:hypothetical protein
MDSAKILIFTTAQPGVYIVMNGTMFWAGEVIKDRVNGIFRLNGT